MNQNGRVTTSTYDAATLTTTVTTPQGRTSTIRKTPQGALAEVTSSGMNAAFTYLVVA